MLGQAQYPTTKGPYFRAVVNSEKQIILSINYTYDVCQFKRNSKKFFIHYKIVKIQDNSRISDIILKLLTENL